MCKYPIRLQLIPYIVDLTLSIIVQLIYNHGDELCVFLVQMNESDELADLLE